MPVPHFLRQGQAIARRYSIKSVLKYGGELQCDCGEVARGTRAHLMAGFGRDAAGQRAAAAALSSASFKVEPGQTGRHRARTTNRANPVAGAGAAAIQSNVTQQLMSERQILVLTGAIQ